LGNSSTAFLNHHKIVECSDYLTDKFQLMEALG